MRAERTSEPVLEAVGLTAGYGSYPVVSNIDISVGAGEVVAFLGANGAGKTTTLLTLAGELRPLNGAVRLLGKPARGSLCERSKAGLGLLTESKSVIFGLSVLDNV